jgi:hypothetical protein
MFLTISAMPSRIFWTVAAASVGWPVSLPTSTIWAYASSMVLAAGATYVGILSAASCSTILLVFWLTTTRSAFFPAMASALGLSPDRSVIGAFAGKFDWSSTATTWAPAPIANRVSVTVADNDTILVGLAARVTDPTVTGKAASFAPPGSPELSSFAQPASPMVAGRASAATSATVSAFGARLGTAVECTGLMGVLLSAEVWCFADRALDGWRPACEAPLLGSAGRDRPRRRPDSSPQEPGGAGGHHSCGTAPDSHRLRCEAVVSTVSHRRVTI